MDFGEWVAKLINHRMNNAEILTYLEPDTREEDLVALVRTLMARYKIEELEIVEPPYDSEPETLRHIARVRELLDNIAVIITNRGLRHDESKLGPIEKPVFDEFWPKLKTSTYGSDEYKGFLKGMEAGLDHHYRVNRHHPEHFEAGVNSMNLIDLIEMLADWKAAGERHENGNLWMSIESNTQRFGMSGWLRDCLLHTAEDLGWWDGVTGEICTKCGKPFMTDQDSMLLCPKCRTPDA